MKTLCALLLVITSLALPAVAAGLPDRITFSVALERGDLPLARQWLDAGLPPDFEGSVIGSGLMIGAWEGSIPMMELFLAHGADVNRVNAVGETALLHAAWKGHLEAVRWLLAHGAQASRPDKQWGALHYAAFAGHAAVVRVLLEQGANVDALSPNGSTPLMMTAREGHAGVATQLLAAGARRDIVNDNGENAVHWAMRNNNLIMAREIAGSEDFALLAAKPAASWGGRGAFAAGAGSRRHAAGAGAQDGSGRRPSVRLEAVPRRAGGIARIVGAECNRRTAAGDRLGNLGAARCAGAANRGLALCDPGQWCGYGKSWRGRDGGKR